MMGFAANYNSTLYAAYTCSPAALAPMFFLLINFFKILMGSATPVLAELTAQGPESQQFLMLFFLFLSLICMLMGLMINV